MRNLKKIFVTSFKNNNKKPILFGQMGESVRGASQAFNFPAGD